MAFNTYKDASGNEQYFKAIDGDGSSGDPAVTGVGILDAAGGAPIGTTTTAAVTSDTNGTVMGFLRGLVKWAYERMPASLGQKASSASLAAVLSTEQEALIGALTEAAPASDTASSGLNGRLQRIAQRITSLIALVPSSLGQKTKANSFAVVLPSDQVIAAGATFYSFHVEGATLQASPAASYASGDCVGVLCELTNIANNKGVRLDSIILQAVGAGTGTWDMTVLFFDSNPSATTFTDDAALTINSADVDKLEAFVPVVNADWKTIGTRKYANLGRLEKVIASSGSVWMAIQADATFDGPANDLEISCGFTQDG